MLIVTHEMDFAMSISDRIVFMEDGLINFVGSPEEIRHDPSAARVRRFMGEVEQPEQCDATTTNGSAHAP